MAWPDDEATPIRQELYVDGEWVDITDDGRGGTQEIGITRGYTSQQAQLGAATISFYLNNRDGQYSNRNPYSPHYGLLLRDTPYRCSLTLAGTSLRLTDTSVLDTGAYDGARAWTADKASLDITGDIDVRIDCEADDWRGRCGQILAAKYMTSGNQRSWGFTVSEQGVLLFFWSSDGTAGARLFARSTALVTGLGRQALRATLDVNNGAAGNTVTFYTSDSISGTWTQLGATVIQSGTTSVFSSTANLEVGTVANGADRGTLSNLNAEPFCGKIYAFELRSSISGTVVAKMDATAQARGTTSWSDGLTSANTWTLTNSAEITDADYRFHAEVPEFPPEWDSSGTDVYVNINASDVVERLTSGQKPLKSPIFRNLSQYDLDSYHTMEDDFSSTERTSAYVGQPGFITDAAFGTFPELPGAAGGLSFTSDDGYASGGVENSGAATGTSYALWYFKFSALPGSEVEFFNSYYTGGNVYRAVVSCSATAYRLKIQDSDYADLVNNITAFGGSGEPTTPIAMRLKMTQSGGTINWEWGWYQVGAPVLWGQSGSFSGTFGKPRSWISWPFTGKDTLQLAHVALARVDIGFTDYSFYGSTNGYVDESARDRAVRLCAEERVPFWWIGPRLLGATDQKSAFMGAQGLLALTDLLQECADTDGGILFSPRDKRGLCIRSYYSMLNRARPELDYTANHLSGKLTPRELRDFRNDVTVTRTGGASGRYVKTEGPNSTTALGRTYDVVVPRSAAADSQLIPLAQREVLFGTWDELRQPSIQVELHRRALLADADLSAAIAALDIGEPLALANLPLWAGGPDDAVTLVVGYVETLGNITRTLRFNAVPYGPYLVGIWGSSSFATASLWAPRYTTLGAGYDDNDTSLSFSISDPREYWSTTNEPYDVKIAGEIMTVTSMGALSGSGPWTQTATVTRSVNGIVKSLPSGSPVELVKAGRWALRSGD